MLVCGKTIVVFLPLSQIALARLMVYQHNSINFSS